MRAEFDRSHVSHGDWFRVGAQTSGRLHRNNAEALPLCRIPTQRSPIQLALS